MFWSKEKELRQKVYELEYLLENNQCDLERYKEKIKALEGRIKELNEQNSDEARSADMQVDFKKMHAFSIERLIQPSSKTPVTAIGYWKLDESGTSTVGEWYLHCSTDTHLRLVNEFRAYQKGTK